MITFYKRHVLIVTIIAIFGAELIKELLYPNKYNACTSGMERVIFYTVIIGGGIELLFILTGLIASIKIKK